MIAHHRGAVDVQLERGRARGILRAHLLDDPPAVGDWLVVQDLDGTVVVLDVLPRQTELVREAAGRTSRRQRIASNVDRVFVLTSANDDLNRRRVERFLAAVSGGGAQGICVLTKCDLAPDVQALLTELHPVPCIPISALTGSGVEALKILPGETVCLMGMSGVGKSTLTNTLLGEDRQVTIAVRDDDRGKHATTHRELFLLPGGGCLIDTPGMRELSLFEGDLDGVFPEIEAAMQSCAYRNCSHVNEPGCGLLDGLEDGSIDPDRLRNWQKLQRELAYATRRQKKGAQRAEQRAFSKRVRQAQGKRYKK
jgi:ribosome biogenesis GTPase